MIYSNLRTTRYEFLLKNYKNAGDFTIFLWNNNIRSDSILVASCHLLRAIGAALKRKCNMYLNKFKFMEILHAAESSENENVSFIGTKSLSFIRKL